MTLFGSSTLQVTCSRAKASLYSFILSLRRGFLALSLRSFRQQSWMDLISNRNDIETKAEQSFVFDIEAKRTCLFQNL
jgi:hypothetical protein